MTPAGFYFDPQTVAGLKDAGNQRQTLERVAQQFEALFVHMLLKQMREASFGDGLTDSSQSTFYRDMFDAQMAQHVGGQAGLGIAQLLVRELGAAAPDASLSEQPDAARLTPAMMSHLSLNPHGAKVAESQIETAFAHAEDAGVDPATGLLPEEPPALPAQWRIHVRASQPVAAVPVGAGTVPDAPRPDATDSWRSPGEFLAHLQPFARQTAQELGVSSDVLLAQATLETGWGRKLPLHPDGRNSFNVFGIKADARWSGDWVSKPTLEFTQGGMRREHAQFRAYASPHESFRDYASFLKDSPRYAKALSVAGDPAAYLHALQDAGYATDPNYAQKILSLIDSERFRSALGDAGAKESSDDAV
jgi:flagellar protein FlgJ